jgi:hypothetical protein
MRQRVEMFVRQPAKLREGVGEQVYGLPARSNPMAAPQQS